MIVFQTDRQLQSTEEKGKRQNQKISENASENKYI